MYLAHFKTAKSSVHLIGALGVSFDLQWLGTVHHAALWRNRHSNAYFEGPWIETEPLSPFSQFWSELLQPLRLEMNYWNSDNTTLKWRPTVWVEVGVVCKLLQLNMHSTKVQLSLSSPSLKCWQQDSVAEQVEEVTCEVAQQETGCALWRRHWANSVMTAWKKDTWDATFVSFVLAVYLLIHHYTSAGEYTAIPRSTRSAEANHTDSS